MNLIDPAELSAYLDGELTEQRRKEVQRHLADEPRLRAELEEMRSLDTAWSEVAALAVSRPSVDLQRDRGLSHANFIAVAFGLLVVRIVPKLMDTVAVGVVLHSTVLAIALCWLLRTESARAYSR